MVVYCAYYGLIEGAEIPGLGPPSRSWQVPKSFVTAASWRRATFVWGAMLGPGFATRNPFAGFAVLPLGVATIGDVRLGLAVAVAIGLAHGIARGVALIRDARSICEANHFQSVLKSMYWRRFDGVALLFLGGLALTTYFDRL